MSILDNIKKGVANSGNNKGKIVYFKPDSKTRVRFLHEVEDGLEVTMHDKFDAGINAVCRQHFGEKCPYCNDDSLRTRKAYVWSVWDHEAKEVKLFMGFPNNFSPLPQIISMFESYGTLKDRDYVIKQDGKGTNKRFSVVPMDKVKFKNKKAKPYPEKKALSIMGKAFPVDDDDLEDNDADMDDNVEDESDYDDMSPKELYLECLERGLRAKKKQKKAYYIELLEEDDAEVDDEDEDDWDEDEDDEDDDDEW